MYYLKNIKWLKKKKKQIFTKMDLHSAIWDRKCQHAACYTVNLPV